MIFGPDDRDSSYTSISTVQGNIGYIGYSFLDSNKGKLTEPVYPAL